VLSFFAKSSRPGPPSKTKTLGETTQGDYLLCSLMGLGLIEKIEKLLVRPAGEA